MAVLILSASKPIASSKLSSALGRYALLVSAFWKNTSFRHVIFCILKVCREYVPKTAYKAKKLLNKYPLRPTSEIITNNLTLSTTRGYLQHDSIFTKLSLLSTFRALIHFQMLPINLPSINCAHHFNP